jgi:predicted SnoaL-like aldol condensation-catalyzing enzyme
LLALTRGLPETLRYENHVAATEGDLVILHGRFSGHGLPRNWIVADIVRLENGVLVEHWNVIQDEATEAESKSGLPMFGASFA